MARTITCDRCGEQTTSGSAFHQLDFQAGTIKVDLCQECDALIAGELVNLLKGKPIPTQEDWQKMAGRLKRELGERDKTIEKLRANNPQGAYVPALIETVEGLDARCNDLYNQLQRAKARAAHTEDITA